MAINEMLSTTLHLEQQPGGISPELHLKEGCSGMVVNLIVLNGKTMLDTKSIRCVIGGVRSDGKELFFTAYSGANDSKVQVKLASSAIREMAGAAGTYKCTLTLLNTSNSVNRQNYKNYDFLTVLPFTVIVHEKAGRDG